VSFLSQNAKKPEVLAKSLVLWAFVLLGQGASLFAQSIQPVSARLDLSPSETPTVLENSLNGVSSDEFENFLKVGKPIVTESPPIQHPSLPLHSLPPPMPLMGSVPNDHAAVQPSPPPATILGTWWTSRALDPILATAPEQVCRVDLEQLIWQSMQYSPRVKSILILPKIQRTEIDVQRGEFDPRRFGQSLYNDNSDPVGNTLTTGGPSRLNEQFWDNSVGIRDRNTFGGKTELSQQIGAKDNNSLFFKPNNQIDSRLSLNYTQPLLRGAGRAYNTSSIAIAGLKTKESIATANRELQDHSLDVSITYWELVLNRHLLLQANNGQARFLHIKQQLQNRQGRDVLPRYFSRADAEIANQRSQAATAIAAVRSSQATLQRLVNAPELETVRCMEIIPLTAPSNEFATIAIDDEIASALLYRGDIAAIRASMESAMVQRQMAQNDQKAVLDLVANTYLRGLEGNNELMRSFRDQFDTGRPSFTAGVTYQNPVYRRAAKATLHGRQLEIEKLLYEHEEAILKIQEQVTTAVGNAEGAYSSFQAVIDETRSQQQEVEEIKTKLTDFFGDTISIGVLLDNLIDAEKRLIAAENKLATQQVQYMIALARIKYESGTLMTITAE
jgi:outer membrane protein TolC